MQLQSSNMLAWPIVFELEIKSKSHVKIGHDHVFGQPNISVDGHLKFALVIVGPQFAGIVILHLGLIRD